MNDLFFGLGDILTSEPAYVSAAAVAALLAFGACGEWIAERSGAINISVEAMMLAGAFGATMGYHLTDRFTVGALFGVGAGLVVGVCQAELSHRLTADQFVVGLSLNILVLGLAGYLEDVIKPDTRRAAPIDIPLLSDIPLVGQALFGQPWLFYMIYPLVPICWWVVYRSGWGLEIRAVGGSPQSADVSGIDVNRRRRQAVYVVGMTSGLGGAYLSLALVGSFEDDIVGGRGFIAMAAVVFGGWTLRGSIAGCVLFGTVLSFRLSLPVLGYEINNELLTALPAIAPIVGMAVFAHRVRAPAALAQPFIRGLR
jgi:simple sugar transport system permease protein